MLDSPLIQEEFEVCTIEAGLPHHEARKESEFRNENRYRPSLIDQIRRYLHIRATKIRFLLIVPRLFCTHDGISF